MLRTMMTATAGAISLLLCACSTPITSTITYYTPDPALTSENAATIIGSKQENPHIFVMDVRVFVPAIDGMITKIGSYTWDQPLLVPPGTHMVRISMWRGDRGMIIEPFVELEAGKTYVARAKIDSHTTATIWLEEIGTGREQARTPGRIGIARPAMAPIIVR